MKVDVWLFGRKSNNKQVNSLCSSHDRSNSFISYHANMFLLPVSLHTVWGQRRLSGTSNQRGGGFSPLPVGSQQGAFPPLSPSFIIKQRMAPNKVFLLKRFMKIFIRVFPAFSFHCGFYFSALIFLLFFLFFIVSSLYFLLLPPLPLKAKLRSNAGTLVCDVRRRQDVT